ncbi:LuxR C-terminal-related transcriptional regulator [Streptomyces sp. NPDC002225]|uniref:response regulator transcription factor n=1 Tax=Streptomyces sp. NPDC002225 TaxID=3154413 RepID=UPI003321B6F1
MYRIGLLHSHPLIAWAVGRALATVPDLLVSTLDADSPATEPSSDGTYDVLITNQMPYIQGIPQEFGGLRASYVLLMEPLPEETAAEAVGTDRCLSEFSSPSELIRAVRRAATAGRRTVNAVPAGNQADTAHTDLSKREQEVLGFIGDGLTHAQVARRLGISQHTVDTYVKRIRSKLRVGNKAELAKAALNLCWAA